MRAGRMVRTATLAAGLALSTALAAFGQEPRLAGRVPDDVRPQVDSLIAVARRGALPTEALVDRALEGASKHATGAQILVALQRLYGELQTARDALGRGADDSELIAGASAIRAGATADDLTQLREARLEGSLLVPAAELANLVAMGVPADTAVGAVLALAATAQDADYVAFRRNVEQDIALGATPIAALGVRLDQTRAAAADGFGTQGVPTPAPGPRKP
jgi:hypothetical protein